MQINCESLFVPTNQPCRVRPAEHPQLYFFTSTGTKKKYDTTIGRMVGIGGIYMSPACVGLSNDPDAKTNKEATGRVE